VLASAPGIPGLNWSSGSTLTVEMRR